MKASELIKVLDDLVKKYGDLPVIFDDGCGDRVVNAVKAYSEHGAVPDKKNPQAIEIFLH